MHLGNSVICPVTGIPAILAMGAAVFWAAKKAKTLPTEGILASNNFKSQGLLPLIALTALVFAMQMINFSIPQTGSSGHIIGVLTLAACLGPYAAFICAALILLVQAVFFGDGGLLAYGCNLFNMGFLTCFIAYPLVFKPFLKKNMPVLASMLASIAAITLGSLAAVVETALSGSTSADILLFAGLMLGVHLVIAMFEGFVTAGIVIAAEKIKDLRLFSLSAGGFALILAAFIYKYASNNPDGLEWSLLSLPNGFTALTSGKIYALIEGLQAKTAVLAALSPSVANILGLVLLCVLTLCAVRVLGLTKLYER